MQPESKTLRKWRCFAYSPLLLLELVQQPVHSWQLRFCTWQCALLSPILQLVKTEASFADNSAKRQIVKANYQPAPESVTCNCSLFVLVPFCLSDKLITAYYLSGYRFFLMGFVLHENLMANEVPVCSIPLEVMGFLVVFSCPGKQTWKAGHREKPGVQPLCCNHQPCVVTASEVCYLSFASNCLLQLMQGFTVLSSKYVNNRTAWVSIKDERQDGWRKRTKM